MELLRDTAFGNIMRLVSGARVRQLQYYDERNSDLRRKFENVSGYERFGSKDSDRKKSNDETSNDELRFNGSMDTSRTMVHGEEEYYDNENTHDDTEKGRNPNLVEFLPNDPENPQNWPLPKKVFVTFQICLLTTSIYVGASIYSAGLPDIMRVFNVGQVSALLGLTLFVAGYGLGPMIWSPLSEIPFIGRNPIYIGTLLLFVLLQIPTAMSTNFSMLLAFRFLTGFVGSPVLATGGATLADIWSPRKRAYAIAIWGVAAVCGPTMGPLLGGFAAAAKGWTWPIWELMWLSGFAFVMLFFFLPETSAANIIYRRTVRLRKATGNSKLVCGPELMVESMTGRDIVMMSLVRPFTLNFTEPMVFLLNLYIALIYGLLYIWFESVPIVFTQIYGFSRGVEGLAFLGILLGSIVILPPFFFYLYKYVEPKFDSNGDIRPEERLPPALVGAFAIPICLFWFGWSSRADVHWIMPIIGSAWFSIGSVLLFNSVLNYLPDAYPAHAASVLAGNDLFRSAFGAGFPLFANAMYARLGIGWASSVLGFLAVAFIPIPLLLYKVGRTLRMDYSKHARKDL